MSRFDDLYAAICERGITDGFGPRGRGDDIQQHPAELAEFLCEMEALGVQSALELGTGPHGGLARFLVDVMHWKVTSIDIVRPDPAPTHEFIQGYTNDEAIIESGLLRRQFDLLIIDADHEYKSVQTDHFLYEKVASIVMIHDIAPGRECCEGSHKYWQEIAYKRGKIGKEYHEHISADNPVGIGWYQRKPIVRREPKVAAIVSVYNSRRFLRGHLDDLLSQTIASQLEIICVNSGSKHPEDAAVLAEYERTHHQVKVVTTKRDPIYVSWNIGIKASKAPYITNSNTDDRHAPWALEKLAEALDNGADVSYGSYYCTQTPNATWTSDWELWLADPVNYPDGLVPWGMHPFSTNRLWQFCFLGPQPMWRRSLHDAVGYLDTSYSIAGDYHLWCKFARAGAKFAPIPLYLGLFYFDKEHNLSQSNHDQLVYENRRIRLEFAELANAA